MARRQFPNESTAFKQFPAKSSQPRDKHCHSPPPSPLEPSSFASLYIRRPSVQKEPFQTDSRLFEWGIQRDPSRNTLKQLTFTATLVSFRSRVGPSRRFDDLKREIAAPTLSYPFEPAKEPPNSRPETRVADAFRPAAYRFRCPLLLWLE